MTSAFEIFVLHPLLYSTHILQNRVVYAVNYWYWAILRISISHLIFGIFLKLCIRTYNKSSIAFRDLSQSVDNLITFKVTFNKRKFYVMKKAYKLSVLYYCDLGPFYNILKDSLVL